MGVRRPAVVLLVCLLLSACGEGDAALSSGRTAPSTSPSTSPEVPPASGDTAVWAVDVEQPPQASNAEVKARVQRMGCASGETGEVLPPEVVEREDEVMVGFTVESLALGSYLCPANKQVAYTVPLSAPLGQRRLVDAACLAGEASTTSHCVEGAQRWPSPR